MAKGSLTLAEGNQKKDFRTDASLILNGVTEVGRVLRTSYDSLPVWKTKYAKNISPFYPRLKTNIRETAVIDNEIWVFGIDGTKAKDIIDAVSIGCTFYKEPPETFLGRIYIKNLNAEGEQGLDLKLLVQLNVSLYEKTVAAIKTACQHFNIKNTDIHVYSAKTNYKIPGDQLHAAMIAGGASSVITDDRELNYRSGSNDALFKAQIDTHMHVAKLSI